jgi:divalent metal cation (Fe/Co/Zn/Cd) transporter
MFAPMSLPSAVVLIAALIIFQDALPIIRKEIDKAVGVKTRENAALVICYGAGFIALAYWLLHRP